jgi:predicted dehydrogenase
MRVLVIGLGSMGRRRIRNLKALGVADIAGYDPRADRREAAASEYGIEPFAGWTAATCAQAGAWVVSTPPLTHLAYALQALAAGVPVFTEADLPDPLAAEVIRRRDETGLLVAPSCTMRHYPGPATVRKLVEEGAIGRPLIFTYQSGQYLPDWHPWEHIRDYYVSQPETGAAREIVPFELVWMTGLFGAVTEIAGLSGASGVLDTPINDHYALALRFATGVAGTLLVDVVARPAVRALRINGAAGTLEWDQAAGEVRVRGVDDAAWTAHALEAGTREAGYINPEEPYIAEMRDFLAAVNGEKPYPFALEDEIALHHVLERMERDAELRAA